MYVIYLKYCALYIYIYIDIDIDIDIRLTSFFIQCDDPQNTKEQDSLLSPSSSRRRGGNEREGNGEGEGEEEGKNLGGGSIQLSKRNGEVKKCKKCHKPKVFFFFFFFFF